MLRSQRSKKFRALYDALPAHARHQADETYQRFKQNPRHPSLRFKAIDPSDSTVYSVRVGAHYRAIGILVGDTVTWV